MRRIASSVALVFLLIPTGAAAFSDVPAGSWFSSAVMQFDTAGYLKRTTRFRPSDPVPRADMVRLIVKLQGKTTAIDADQVFEDVGAGHPAYGVMQAAAAARWLLGDHDCLGSHPCFASPDRIINRAEAAAMLTRAYGLGAVPSAPVFSDARAGEWFSEAVTTAAGHCLLKGDDGKTTVRPGALLNRAEMAVMLLRVYAQATYPDCSPDSLQNVLLPIPGRTLSSSSALTSASSFSSSTSSSVAPAPSLDQLRTSSAKSGVGSVASSTSSSSSHISNSSSSSVASPAPRSSESGVGSASSLSADPSASTMQVAYFDYLTQMASLILQAKNYTANTSSRMFKLLNQRVDLIEQYNALFLTAQSRPLTAAESQSVTQVQASLETNFTAITVIQGAGR